MGTDFEEIIQAFIKESPRVLSEVQAKLPKSFPAEVADPVLQGLLAQARLLEGMPSGLVAA
jgi:serine/threonine-protein kinase HipA